MSMHRPRSPWPLGRSSFLKEPLPPGTYPLPVPFYFFRLPPSLPIPFGVRNKYASTEDIALFSFPPPSLPARECGLPS